MILKIWKKSKLKFEKIWKNTEENCEAYGRIVSRIVIRYGQYGRKQVEQ